MIETMLSSFFRRIYNLPVKERKRLRIKKVNFHNSFKKKSVYFIEKRKWFVEDVDKCQYIRSPNLT